MPQSPAEIPAADANSGHVLNPASMPVDALARMLGLPPSALRRHVEEGAPTNSDGTINLVHYAAWLNAPSIPETGKE